MNERNSDSPPTKGELLPRNDEAKPEVPVVAQRPDAGQIQQFITEIKSAETQVGEHIITALQDPDNVAVITTVVIGPDGKQRIVSAALNPGMMQEVQKLLIDAQREREEDVPCVGFHCYTRPRNRSQDESTSAPKDNA